MKKKIILALGAIGIAGVIGFTTFQSGIVNAEPKLSKEDIRNQVTSQYPGIIKELELEKKDRVNFYEVEVVLEGKAYELKIHADTGDVLKLEEKVASTEGVTESEKGITDRKTDDTSVKNNDDQKGTEDVSNTKNATPKQTVINSDEAKNIALENFEGSIVKLELDDDDNRYSYEIEIVNGNRKAEIEIDAYTGKVIVLEIETADISNDD